MKHGMSCLLAGLILAGVAAQAAVETGAAAPDFAVADTAGKTQKLADQKGKYVVLEWYNPGCPYVRKQYDAGNLQKVQQELTGQGVVWYTVITGAPAGRKVRAEKDAAATAVLLDSDGALGKSYGAKSTPHVFVISPDQKVIYQGALDDNAQAQGADIAASKNYVRAAINAAKANQPVEPKTTKPYGCSVKYP